jgi:hypothetical protein
MMKHIWLILGLCLVLTGGCDDTESDGDGDGDVDADGDSDGDGDGDGDSDGDGDTCTSDDECDDGDPCNGAETCSDGACEDGASIDCDDGIACTSDECDGDTGDCTSTPDDDLCDDGQICTWSGCDDPIPCDDDEACDDGNFCNGVETCDPEVGCRPGERPDCDDGVECTDDICDADADECVNVTADDACDDGLFCNGTETCSATEGCLDGEPVDCDDGVACTMDSCDDEAESCVNETDDTSCDDGVFCNGVETCDLAGGCIPGDQPDCDDDIACTVDACDAAIDVCTHGADDSLCDDGSFCSGVETCDVVDGCIVGGPPDCNDDIACTDDECSDEAGECINTPVDRDGDGELALACGGDDCDDSEAAINGGATEEICSGVDEDCDPSTEDAPDGDGDGFDLCGAGDMVNPDDRATDCDDDDAAIYPGAAERCNGEDDSCDGSTDEGFDDTDTDGMADCVDPDDDGDGICDFGVEDDSCTPVFGGGGDGDVAVGAGLRVTLDEAPLAEGRTAPDMVHYQVVAISDDGVDLGVEPVGLVEGDEVLLINLQGNEDDHDAVGSYEFLIVAAVGETGLTFDGEVLGAYGVAGDNADLTGQVVVVQRVPHYDSVTVAEGGILDVSSWNGMGGGILVFRCGGEVMVEAGGLIDVTGRGYAGGPTGGEYNFDAFQGESIAGVGVRGPYPSSPEGPGCAANYGGGGVAVTGGGGNYGGGATDAVSWDGGGYCDPAAGEPYGAPELEQLYLGSGGGGVWQGTPCCGSEPGPGGTGGGMIYIAAREILLVEGALRSDGQEGLYAAQGSWTYGAGGGSGGSIHLVSESVEIGEGMLTAAGATGYVGLVIRDGGHGGAGRIRIDATELSGATDPEALTTEP